MQSVDLDSSGMVEENELAKLLKSMGIHKSKSEAKKYLKSKKKKHATGPVGINFDEFVELMFRY